MTTIQDGTDSPRNESRVIGKWRKRSSRRPRILTDPIEFRPFLKWFAYASLANLALTSSLFFGGYFIDGLFLFIIFLGPLQIPVVILVRAFLPGPKNLAARQGVWAASAIVMLLYTGCWGVLLASSGSGR